VSRYPVDRETQEPDRVAAEIPEETVLDCLCVRVDADRLDGCGERGAGKSSEGRFSPKPRWGFGDLRCPEPKVQANGNGLLEAGSFAGYEAISRCANR